MTILFCGFTFFSTTRMAWCTPTAGTFVTSLAPARRTSSRRIETPGKTLGRNMKVQYRQLTGDGDGAGTVAGIFPSLRLTGARYYGAPCQASTYSASVSLEEFASSARPF